MASWIVHLRIAEILLGEIPELDRAYFAMGNVAPDSGVPDENWEHFDPPPEVTHFKIGAGEGKELADLRFYRQNILPWTGKSSSPARWSFLWGYFFHLVTDNLWSERISKPTMTRFAREFEQDPKFIWQVKRDWYGLDFEYVRGNPASIFWQDFLPSQYDADYLPFLPQSAVQRQLAYIKDFYQRRDEKVEQWYLQRPDRYLDAAAMDAFIVEASKIMQKAYHLLKQGDSAHAGMDSILEHFARGSSA